MTTTPTAAPAAYLTATAPKLERSIQVECYLRLATSFCKLAANECAGTMPELAHELVQVQFGLELKTKAMEKVNAA